MPRKGEIAQGRVGEVNYNRYGSKMTIVEYEGDQYTKVEFDNGYITTTQYQCFKRGGLKSPYCKTLLNLGYIGEGKYKTKDDGKTTKQYMHWGHIFRRCYDNKYKLKHPTYINCEVCKEWHNFQNFGKWFDKNYYEIEGEPIQLDKDILHKGNKIYSPENCVFVPQGINKIFTKRDNDRGEYPIGVTYSNKNNNYIALCNNNGKQIHLGVFNTPKEAFNKYKRYKENYIKEVADEYKDKISKELYEAMYRYEVEITD